MELVNYLDPLRGLMHEYCYSESGIPLNIPRDELNDAAC
jgi:hypothetical protein